VATFRKIVLPVLWLVVFGAIAVSLTAMAFGGDSSGGDDDGVRPTGNLPSSETVVERLTIENSLKVPGTIAVDPAVPAEAGTDGVVNHVFVPAGTKVDKGEPLFQVRAEAEATEPADDEESDEPPAAPAPRYVTVVAPADGTVGELSVDLGDTVTKDTVVTTVAQRTFRASGSIAPITRYRLLDLPKSATVTIPTGPKPFECRDLTIGDEARSAPPADGEDEPVDPAEEEMYQDPGAGGGEAGASISCRVPSDVRVFDGLTMTMTIDAGSAEDVLAVPITSVRGAVDSGTVWVLDDAGEPVAREVTLGLTDGTHVEVVKGVEEGEALLEFAPGTEPEGMEEG
jgi:macrolide-specific efflux system membrane fusion protein